MAHSRSTTTDRRGETSRRAWGQPTRRGLAILWALTWLAASGHAQLDETCTVALQNRTAPVAEDGSWVIRNASGTVGPYRVRAICVDENGTRAGESDLAFFNSGESVRISDISFEAATPIPTTLALSASPSQLDAVGAQTQIEVTAHYPDGSTAEVAAAATGTSYRVSSETVASVDADGLVTAPASGAMPLGRHGEAVQPGPELAFLSFTRGLLAT